MDENVVPLLSQWMDNNSTSFNLCSVIQVFIDKVDILKKDAEKNPNYKIVIWHSYNLLFIIRNMMKYLIETLTEDNLVKHCKSITDSDKSDETGNGMLESLLNALMEVLVDVQLEYVPRFNLKALLLKWPFFFSSEFTYNLHVEACKAFLVLLSVQMFSAKPSSKSIIYNMVMQKKCSIHALLFTKTLLNNFIQQVPAPAAGSGSLVFGLASGLWGVLTLGYGNKKTEEEIIYEALLARQSLLLLLVLTNHCTKEINPYREALFQCSDSGSELGDQNMTGFKVEFASLYKTLNTCCSKLNDDQTTLLLYMLLHQNQHFKTFVLSRTTDLDQFVVPVLRILYNSPDRNSHHIYMALIILLVLSEDRFETAKAFIDKINAA